MDTIGIIGTAGRREDATRLDVAAYDRMYEAVGVAIEEWGCKGAVSGGAAWADHLAVRAYLDGLVDRLTLHLPAPLENGRYALRGDGPTANRYHDAFARACGVDSFAEIAKAVERGAILKVWEGFKPRNLRIGMDATHLLAFTFGQSMNAVQDHGRGDMGFSNPTASGLRIGGTSHGWQNARNPTVKRHVNLNVYLAQAAESARTHARAR